MPLTWCRFWKLMNLVEILRDIGLTFFIWKLKLFWQYKCSSILESWAFCEWHICMDFLSKSLFIYKSLHRMKLLNLELQALSSVHSSCMLGMLTCATGFEVKLHFLLFWSFQIGLSWNWYTIMTQVHCKVFIRLREIWYRVAKSVCRASVN